MNIFIFVKYLIICKIVSLFYLFEIFVCFGSYFKFIGFIFYEMSYERLLFVFKFRFVVFYYIFIIVYYVFLVVMKVEFLFKLCFNFLFWVIKEYEIY